MAPQRKLYSHPLFEAGDRNLTDEKTNTVYMNQ